MKINMLISFISISLHINDSQWSIQIRSDVSAWIFMTPAHRGPEGRVQGPADICSQRYWRKNNSSYYDAELHLFMSAHRNAPDFTPTASGLHPSDHELVVQSDAEGSFSGRCWCSASYPLCSQKVHYFEEVFLPAALVSAWWTEEEEWHPGISLVSLWESERGAKHSCFLTMCRSDRSSFLSLTQEVVTPKVLHMCRGHRSGPHIMLFQHSELYAPPRSSPTLWHHRSWPGPGPLLTDGEQGARESMPEVPQEFMELFIDSLLKHSQTKLCVYLWKTAELLVIWRLTDSDLLGPPSHSAEPSQSLISRHLHHL